MATETKTYNGWTNYETWCVKLWMDNEEGSYRGGRAMAQDAYDSAEADKTFTRKERAALDLADTLKSEYEEANPLGSDASVWSDLLSAALSEVNWMEIATNMMEEVEEEEEEPDEEEEEEPDEDEDDE